MLKPTQRNSFLLFLYAFLFVLCANSICDGQTIPEKCDFSKYKPIEMSHFLPNSIIEQAKPIYPSAAKAVKAEGKVRVKIIVDLKGRVRNACVIEGHPLLNSEAIKAARSSRFKSNFGLTLPQKHFGRRFITDELEYEFKAN